MPLYCCHGSNGLCRFDGSSATATGSDCGSEYNLTAALAVALTLAQEGIQDLLNLTYSKLTTHKSQGE